MREMPSSVRPLLKRLQRRLAIGLFLDIWPAWAGAVLIVSGTIALVCRMFFVSASPILPWLWIAPILAAIPVLVVCMRRAYAPQQVAALADWLAGGQGILLTLLEKDDPAWAASPLTEKASRFQLPRFRFKAALTLLVPATLFLAVALMLPQRVPSHPANTVLAQEIASNLTAALVELKKQELITPAEEQKLEEEIERIQKSAEKRVDNSSWEAADALKEKVAAGLAEKQEAVKWAQDSLARYAAAVQAGGPADPRAKASAAELTAALEKLAQSGMMAGASPELKALLKSGKFPTDLAALQQLAMSISDQLGEANGKFAGLGKLGREFGRFNPSEFPLDGPSGPDGDGVPGRGGVNRGRADADLTWGQETARLDKFKSRPLPPGAPRSPDDWAPVVVLPGSPQEAAVLSAQAAARQYAAGAGQSAWRRSLAPRHQSAVKKYFDKDKKDKDK
jgi:hypothetical protein